MKKIIKSAILFSICFAFANKSNAQLASDAPSPAAPVHLTVPEVKVPNVPTASSAPLPKVTVAAKSSNKAAAQIPAVNPVTSQGKEIIKPVLDSLKKLPVVSQQIVPVQKSE
jgi:hypothetical protein